MATLHAGEHRSIRVPHADTGGLLAVFLLDAARRVRDAMRPARVMSFGPPARADHFPPGCRLSASLRKRSKAVSRFSTISAAISCGGGKEVGIVERDVLEPEDVEVDLVAEGQTGIGGVAETLALDPCGQRQAAGIADLRGSALRAPRARPAPRPSSATADTKSARYRPGTARPDRAAHGRSSTPFGRGRCRSSEVSLCGRAAGLSERRATTRTGSRS